MSSDPDRDKIVSLSSKRANQEYKKPQRVVPSVDIKQKLNNLNTHLKQNNMEMGSLNGDFQKNFVSSKTMFI